MKKAHDQYGAVLLGIAIRNIFSDTNYLGSFVHSRGFSSTFCDNCLFQKEFLYLLEKQIQKLFQMPYQVMEMAADNAIEMLTFHGQPPTAPLSGSVFIAKIGSYFEPCKIEPIKSENISLIDFEKKGNHITVTGKTFENHLSKQHFIRLYRKRKSHSKIAKDLELYDENRVHPRGVLLKKLIEEVHSNFSLSMGYVPIEVSNPIQYAIDYQSDRILVGTTHYALSLESAISSLQVIQKWVDMFGFKSRWFFGKKTPKKIFRQILENSQISYEFDSDMGENSLEIRVNDFLECQHRVCEVKASGCGVSFSLMENSWRWLHLLLEKYQGFLPKWLQPEEVRLITDVGVDFSKITKKLQNIKTRYTVDQGDASLKEKMYRALRVNVPCVIVFGKREENSREMIIRNAGSKKNKVVSLNQVTQSVSELYFES